MTAELNELNSALRIVVSGLPPLPSQSGIMPMVVGGLGGGVGGSLLGTIGADSWRWW